MAYRLELGNPKNPKTMHGGGGGVVVDGVEARW